MATNIKICEEWLEVFQEQPNLFEKVIMSNETGALFWTLTMQEGAHWKSQSSLKKHKVRRQFAMGKGCLSDSSVAVLFFTNTCDTEDYCKQGILLGCTWKAVFTHLMGPELKQMWILHDDNVRPRTVYLVDDYLASKVALGDISIVLSKLSMIWDYQLYRWFFELSIVFNSF